MSTNSKIKLAKLFSQLNYFQPERDAAGVWSGKFLVNQNKPEREAPDRDALLHMIGEASIELREYIESYQQLAIIEANESALIVEFQKALSKRALQKTKIRL